MPITLKLNKIYLFFGIGSSDRKAFGILYVYSFFIGLYLAFYPAPAFSFFLTHHGTQQLGLAYLISGILGFLITSVFSRMQKRVSVSKLYQITLISILLLIFLIIVCQKITSENQTIQSVISFAVFVLSTPFSVLIAVIFGGLVLKIFDISQGKRLLALVNTSGILASMIGSFCIPALIRTPLFTNSVSLFSIAIIGIAGCFFTLRRMQKMFSAKLSVTPTALQKDAEKKAKGLFSDSYIVIIGIMAFISVIVIFFTDFVFMGSIKIYLKEPMMMTAFISVFYGFVRLGELIMSFVSGGLLKQFGMKFGLTSFSVLMILWTVLALIFGGLFLFSVTPFNDFVFFFVIIALMKLIDRVYRKSIDDPSFRILFQPLSDEQKFSSQTTIEGIVRQVGIGIAGVSLVGLAELFESNEKGMIYFLMAFLPILILWGFIALRLYKSYKKKITNLLSLSKPKRNIDLRKSVFGSDILIGHLQSDNKYEVRLSAILLTQTNFMVLKHHETKFSTADDPVLQNNAKLVQNILSVHATKSSHSAENPDYDPNTELLISIIAHPKPEHLNTLIRLFEKMKYRCLCCLGLIKLGDDAIHDLEIFFRRNAPVDQLKRIVEIYARINSEKSNEKLISLLNYPDAELRNFIIKALLYINYRANDKQKPVFKEKISETVNHILWSYSCILDMEGEQGTMKLVQSVEAEIEAQFSTLYSLLSLIYDPELVDLIKQNSMGENDVFVNEIVENFFTSDIRELIGVLFEGNSKILQLKKYNRIFPQRRLPLQERLRDIIHYDFNGVNLWTKARTIDVLAKLVSGKIPSGIKACIFHPNKVLANTAIAAYTKLLETNPEKEDLMNYVVPDTAIFEILKQLHRVPLFFNIPESLLFDLAESVQIYTIDESAEISFFDAKGTEFVFFVSKGKISDDKTEFTKNSFIIRGINTGLDCRNLQIEKSASFLKMNKYSLFYLLSSDATILQSIYEKADRFV